MVVWFFWQAEKKFEKFWGKLIWGDPGSWATPSGGLWGDRFFISNDVIFSNKPAFKIIL